MSKTENPGSAWTKREILRSAECSYCGYMVPAVGVTIPPELDVSKFHPASGGTGNGPVAPQARRCQASACVPKGGQTVSFIDGRLQYTLPTPSGSRKSESR